MKKYSEKQNIYLEWKLDINNERKIAVLHRTVTNDNCYLKDKSISHKNNLFNWFANSRFTKGQLFFRNVHNSKQISTKFNLALDQNRVHQVRFAVLDQIADNCVTIETVSILMQVLQSCRSFEFLESKLDSFSVPPGSQLFDFFSDASYNTKKNPIQKSNDDKYADQTNLHTATRVKQALPYFTREIVLYCSLLFCWQLLFYSNPNMYRNNFIAKRKKHHFKIFKGRIEAFDNT